MTKKMVSVGLFIFWIVVAAILVGGLIFYNKDKNVGTTTESVTNTIAPVAENTQTIPAQKPKVASSSSVSTKFVPPIKASLTVAIIAEHNTASSCWMIIRGNVYDVTSYIPKHPGGSEKIIWFCGKDATKAFETRGDKGPHPEAANAILEKYLLGKLAM